MVHSNQRFVICKCNHNGEHNIKSLKWHLYPYPCNSIDDLLVVIFAVHHTLCLQSTKIAHYLSLHALQWKAKKYNK